MAFEDNPFAASDTAFSADDPWADSADLELLKADRLQRGVGAFIDGLLPLVIAIPLSIGALVLMADKVGRDPDLTEAMLYGVYFAATIPFTFANWYFIVTRGQSLGKMAVGTRIVTEEGGPVDFVKGVILRNWVIAIISGFCGLASLIDAMLIFGDKKQCGHDMIAKTIVVNASSWNPYEG